ncbi:MAG: TonB-dependent receptor [Gemmatimonadota bacterium]|nr:TonB-dependent receptor [Gemmatimonadota bacterium]
MLLTSAVAQKAVAQTGKLTGVVTDSETGEPVEGVQVVVQGTGYGAVTQSNGRYFLIALPPGTYSVQARRIGYQTTQTSLSILIDVTREWSPKLPKATTTLTEVRIEAARENLVELSQTGSTNQVTTQEIEALPVRSIKDVLTLQSGFQEIPTISTDLTSFTASRRNNTPPILIRGGRAGETMTLIDGIPVNNFLFGGPSLDITRKAVQNLQLIKGGMEPQYGNALSGVINIATKEGGTSLEGSLEYETSRFGGALGNTQDDLRGYDFVEGFLSGPVPATANKLRFMVAGRTTNEASEVLEFDDEIFNPFVPDTISRDPHSLDVVNGWRSLGFRSQRDIYGKLTFYFTPTAKLSVGGLHYERETMQVPFDWMFTGQNISAACQQAYSGRYGNDIDVADVCDTFYDADRVASSGRPQGSARYEFTNPAIITQRRDLFTGRYEQTLGRLNLRVVGGVFDQRRLTCATFFSGVCLGERIADTNFTGRFVTPGVTTPDLTPTEGTDEIAGNDKMRTILGRFDAELQATDHHNLSAGVFYQTHDITFREVRDVGLNNIVLRPSDYAAEPWDAAAYIQDRIEYDFLTVRLGARFDYG